MMHNEHNDLYTRFMKKNLDLYN